MALAAEQPSSEILRLISSDLGELTRPILAYRALPVDMTAATTPAAGGGAEAGAVGQTLLRFADGAPMLLAGSPIADAPAAGAEGAVSAPGLVMYLAVAPEVAWTNLPTKPLMVPLMHEMVRQGLSVIRASQKADVGDQPVLALAGAAARDLRAPAGHLIPLLRGKPQQALDSAGVYDIVDDARQSIGLLAVNVDSKAGVTDVQSAAAVESWLGRSGPWTAFEPDSLARTLGGAASGSPLAGLLLLVVLALVILEPLMARWVSHAYRREEHGDRLAISASMGGKGMGRAAGAQEVAA